MMVGANAAAGQLGNRCLGDCSKLVSQPVHPPLGRAGALWGKAPCEPGLAK